VVSDTTLRDLERAAREGGDGAAWTRLALGRARAGLDARRAAVQALQKDPAAPVRELLPRGEVPGPRALGEGWSLELITEARRSPPTDVVDLGGGRALLVSGKDELAAIDLFAGAVVWRRPRPTRCLTAAPVVVGERLVELHATKSSLRVVWLSAATGLDEWRVELPDSPDLFDPHDLPYGALLALDARRCAALTPDRDRTARVTWLDVEERKVVGAAPLEGDGSWERTAIAAGELVVHDGDGTIEALAVGGRRVWQAPAADLARPIAARGGRIAVEAFESDGRAWHVVLDAADGRRLASVPHATRDGALGERLLVVSRPPASKRAPIEAWSTEGAGRVWEAEVACLVEHDLTLHAAGDVVVVVRSVGTFDGARVLETTGLDAATGALLWERRAPREEALVRPVGGLLLAVRPPEGLVRPTSQVSLVGARDA
jgi:outer membrane protein assembly factor BamB